MSVINFKSPILDQEGQQTRVINMAVTDNLTAITTAGWLNGLKDSNGNLVLGNNLIVNAGDFLNIAFGDGQAAFQASVANGIYTLIRMQTYYRFDVACTSTALASSGKVNLWVPQFSSQQVYIQSLWINSGGTNFSGGSGNRNLSITDGTTAFSVVPAATLESLVNSGWGISTPFPFPASAPINTKTVAGASLYAQYSGGSADFTAGSIVVSGVVHIIA